MLDDTLNDVLLNTVDPFFTNVVRQSLLRILAIHEAEKQCSFRLCLMSLLIEQPRLGPPP